MGKALTVLAIVLAAAIASNTCFTLLLWSRINSLEDQVSNLTAILARQNQAISSLNSTVNQMSSRAWHEVFEKVSETGESSYQSPIFDVKGEVGIRWYCIGTSAVAWITINIYYSNGTLWTNRGSSGSWSSYGSEIYFREPGKFYIEVKTYDAESWSVYVWDYY